MQPGLIFRSDDFSNRPFDDGEISQQESRDLQRGSPRILVVDDQQLIADTLAAILIDAGFEAMIAYDGLQALEIASRFQPDWLLSDILMPRMNGVALAIEIRKRHPATAILLLSGQAGISETLQEGHAQGYDFEVLAKPIHPRELLERLGQP